MLKFKDPSRNKNQNITETWMGKGFSDAQMAIMADDFARYAEQNKNRVRDELRTESQRVQNVRFNSAKIAAEQVGKKPFYTDEEGNVQNIGNYSNPDSLTLNDSILKSGDSKMLQTEYSTSLGQTGMACNAYACNIQQEGDATVPEDFSYRRMVDGKTINLDKGDPIPTIFSNQQMDILAPKFGYEHVQLKDANQVHETGLNQDYAPGTNPNYTVFRENKNLKKGGAEEYIKNIREVDKILPGDIHRGGFNPRFNDSGEMQSNTTHSMTAGRKGELAGEIQTNHYQLKPRRFSKFYSNPGNMEKGIKTTKTRYEPSATYLRYVGKTKQLKEDFKRASFTSSMTKRPVLKTKPISSVSMFPKITGSLLKK